jgi:hypothetical protein
MKPISYETSPVALLELNLDHFEVFIFFILVELHQLVYFFANRSNDLKVAVGGNFIYENCPVAPLN